MHINVGFVFLIASFPCCLGTTASLSFSPDETQSRREDVVNQGPAACPVAWLGPRHYSLFLHFLTFGPQHRSCNNLSQALLGLPTPLLQTICQLLNLAADLFPQLMEANRFALACKKSVSLAIKIYISGKSNPSAHDICEQYRSSLSHFTEENLKRLPCFLNRNLEWS